MGCSLLLERVSKNLGAFTIRDVDLEVASGEYFVILGPSGAGKTVLLQLIAGILRPDSGRILVDGADVTRQPPEKRGVGYVPQNYALFPHMSVYDNIAFGLRLRGISEREIRERVAEIAERLGIGGLLRRKPSTLSGGEAQRVALARALAVEPRLLLLDEPLAAVDPVLRWELRGYLKRLRDKFGVTVVHVTHDFGEALALADRIAVMNRGKIEQVGLPHEVFYKPRSEFVAWFTRAGNIYRGSATPIGKGLSRVRVGPVSFTVCGEYSGSVVITFRPEHVVVSKEAVKTSARNTLCGRVVDCIDEGPLVLLCVDVGGLEVKAYITRSSFLELGIRRGEEVYLYVKASQVHVIR